MKNEALSLILITVSVLTLSGCTSSRVSLVDQELINVEEVPNERIEILWTDVYQDGEKVMVSGALKQHGHSNSPVKAHVDASIIGPDGLLIEESSSPVLLVPRNIGGGGIDWERFRINLQNPPPRGSQVKLTVHSELHNNS
ncbi:MAG: putative periplasmic lipoprotein [Planctomycetota bacterium]|jgi:hypothetical protein